MQTAHAANPPPPAPYEADFTYPPEALVCAGSTIVAAGQDVAFLQRGKPALHASLRHRVDVLRSATVDGKIVLAAAFARHVERLAQGKWTVLAPPLGDGEDIRDVAFSRTGALFVLTRTALYTEGALGAARLGHWWTVPARARTPVGRDGWARPARFPRRGVDRSLRGDGCGHPHRHPVGHPHEYRHRPRALTQHAASPHSLP